MPHAILHVQRRVLEAEGNWGGELTRTTGTQEQHFVAVTSLWGLQGHRGKRAPPAPPGAGLWVRQDWSSRAELGFEAGLGLGIQAQV